MTEDQIARSKEIDLLTYLQQYNPQELVKISENWHTTKTHDSVRINTRRGTWSQFSTAKGGKTALSYLTFVEGRDFKDCVLELAGESRKYSKYPTNSKLEVKQIEEKPVVFRPPKADLFAENENAIRYLKRRGIHTNVINHCIKKEILYEDERQNLVFTGKDMDGKIRYAVARGTGDKKFFKEALGSNKSYAFCIPSVDKSSQELIVFESAMDLISYCSLCELSHKTWKNQHLLSLGGVQKVSNEISSTLPLALRQYLKNYPKVTNIAIFLDNDSIGQGAAKGIVESIRSLEMYKKKKVRNYIVGKGKDVNDYLCMKIQEIKKDKELQAERTVINKKIHRNDYEVEM